jgi:hypothetical protein
MNIVETNIISFTGRTRTIIRCGWQKYIFLQKQPYKLEQTYKTETAQHSA